MLPPHRLVDRPDLRAVTESKCLDEAASVVGVEDRAGASAGDGDVGESGIDGVGAERLQMRHDAGRRGTLGAGDGADPTGTDVTIGEVAKVEL